MATNESYRHIQVQATPALCATAVVPDRKRESSFYTMSSVSVCSFVRYLEARRVRMDGTILATPRDKTRRDETRREETILVGFRLDEMAGLRAVTLSTWLCT
jgi:hypothetical protein